MSFCLCERVVTYTVPPLFPSLQSQDLSVGIIVTVLKGQGSCRASATVHTPCLLGKNIDPTFHWPYFCYPIRIAVSHSHIFFSTPYGGLTFSDQAHIEQGLWNIRRHYRRLKQSQISLFHINVGLNLLLNLTSLHKIKMTLKSYFSVYQNWSSWNMYNMPRIDWHKGDKRKGAMKICIDQGDL